MVRTMAKSRSHPRIAAVMAAHNADDTLVQAVESLLIDGLPVDVFIVDDASRTPVSKLFKKVPSYVHILRQEKNVGAAKARNVAMREILAKGYQYVAIMDSDDVALPGRISKTVEFLEKNPEVAAVGGWAHCVDEDSLETLYDYCYPTSYDAIRQQHFWDASFVHSTVTFRASSLERTGIYDEGFPVAQDYELLCRVAQQCPVANIPEFTLLYRISSKGISSKRTSRQRLARLQVQCRYFSPFHMWAWLGLARSATRVATPTAVVFNTKKVFKAVKRAFKRS